MPGRSHHARRLLTTARFYLNLTPELPQNWGKINPNHNDYHSDPMDITRTFWIPVIMDWWRRQEDTHSKYVDLGNVARNIFSIIQHGVGVEAGFSLGQVVISLRQSKTTGETLPEKVVARQFKPANNGLLAGDDRVLHTMIMLMTWKWRDRQSKRNCTEWPRSTMFWRCGRVARTYVQHRRNRALKTSIWLRRIHIRYQRDHQSILVELSTW